MAEWKCVRSMPGSMIPASTVIEADEVPHGMLIVSETKRKMNGQILLSKGFPIAINGALWDWELVK